MCWKDFFPQSTVLAFLLKITYNGLFWALSFIPLIDIFLPSKEMSFNLSFVLENCRPLRCLGWAPYSDKDCVQCRVRATHLHYVSVRNCWSLGKLSCFLRLKFSTYKVRCTERCQLDVWVKLYVACAGCSAGARYTFSLSLVTSGHYPCSPSRTQRLTEIQPPSWILQEVSKAGRILNLLPRYSSCSALGLFLLEGPLILKPPVHKPCDPLGTLWAQRKSHSYPCEITVLLPHRGPPALLEVTWTSRSQSWTCCASPGRVSWYPAAVRAGEGSGPGCVAVLAPCPWSWPPCHTPLPLLVSPSFSAKWVSQIIYSPRESLTLKFNVPINMSKWFSRLC